MTFLSQLSIHADKAFLRRLFAIALPITLQSIMFSSRSLVDVLMLGQLGEAEIAAVGVAAQSDICHDDYVGWSDNGRRFINGPILGSWR